MKNRRTFLIALIFLAVIPACVIPGLSTSSVPLPTLTVDTGQIETMVAGTVSAAIAQTEQAVPSLTPTTAFAATFTATSTSGLTATVQSTSTSTPTLTNTYTPAPTGTATARISRSQSSLVQQQDGSMLFTDDLAGYEIKLPAGWLAMRINEGEYLDAFSLPEASNMNVRQSLLGVQKENPNILRLFAIDIKAEHIKHEYVSDMRFALDDARDISLNSYDDLQAIASKIPSSAEVFRFEVTSVNIYTTASGLDIGVIESRSSFASSTGADVIIYRKQVFFNVPSGTQSITLTTLADLKETLLAAFDAMPGTVKIIFEG
jgi:hypothetical protein